MSPALGSAFLRTLVSGEVRETFDSVSLSGCDVHGIRAGEGEIQCRVRVTPSAVNMFDTMHGGCLATLVDVVSTAALVTVTGKPGVSVSITMNYVRAGAKDAELEVRSRVAKHGKRLATMITDVVDVASGELCVTGTHVKSMGSGEAHFVASKL
jgi:acyl-coenzyme A thioesterase 13